MSFIRCANEDGALSLHSEQCQTQVTVRDLTLLAEIPGAGTALEVSSPPRGVRNYRTLTVENVNITGNTFNGKGTALQTAPGARDIRMHGNHVINRHVKVSNTGPPGPESSP